MQLWRREPKRWFFIFSHHENLVGLYVGNLHLLDFKTDSWDFVYLRQTC